MSGQIKLRREVFNAMNDYVKHLVDGYKSSTQAGAQMVKDYQETMRIKRDKLYTRVFVRGSIHSFIVMQDYSKFKRGDILRPRNRTTPDTDFVHGNVLESKYEKITWSGI